MPRPTRRGWRVALVAAAALCGAGVWWLYDTMVADGSGQVLDKRLTTRLAAIGGEAPTGVLDLLSVGTLLVAIAAVLLIAAVRRRPDLALTALVLVVGANLTTQVLKEVLDRPRLGLGFSNSLPSGHTTVAASVAAALVIVVPVALRPVVALAGLGFAVWTGQATIVAHWHRVSDVVAALLVVLGWTALSLTLVRTGPRRRRPPATPSPPVGQLGLTRR